jgi:hypothetical protein
MYIAYYSRNDNGERGNAKAAEQGGEGVMRAIYSEHEFA